MKAYEPGAGEHIDKTAQRMVELANFGGEVVTATFNDIPLDTAPGGNPKNIVAHYNAESYRRRREYEASPEYAKRQQEAKDRDAAKAKAIRDELAVAPATLTLSDEPGWKSFVDANREPYGAVCVRYADKWARIMEARIAKGQTLKECAHEASRIADDEGITGFMYGCAVSMLAQCWTHGEELRRWHNLETQIGSEGARANERGGVLNPALLNIG